MHSQPTLIPQLGWEVTCWGPHFSLHQPARAEAKLTEAFWHIQQTESGHLPGPRLEDNVPGRPDVSNEPSLRAVLEAHRQACTTCYSPPLHVWGLRPGLATDL